MWDFLATYINWILGILAVVIWAGSFGWYFYPEVRNKWQERLDHWR